MSFIMEGRIPQGKGMFIHYLSRLFDGDMAKLADYLKENHYTWVAPKMQDGQLSFDANDQQSYLNLLVPELVRVGVDLVGWGYIYGETNLYRKLNGWATREKNKTIEMIAKYKPIAWMVNAEKEFKNNANAAASAIKYMDSVKADMAVTNDAIPEIPIGLSSYRFPNLHNTFPWLEFISRCEFVAPQVYWWDRTDPNAPVEELMTSIEQYKQYGAEGLPFVVAGTTRDENTGWVPTPEQMRNFNQAVYDHPDVVGVNWWELYYLFLTPENEAIVSEFIWEVEDQTPPEQPSEVLELFERIYAGVMESHRKIDDLARKLAIHHLDVQDWFEELAGAPEDPDSEIRWMNTRTDKARIPFTFAKGENDSGFPIFEFYPSDSAPVAERVFVAGGSQVPVFANGMTKGDDGRIGWMVDKSQLTLMIGSAPLPDVDLYLDEKFIV